jgi:hypothetical protein
MDSCFLGRESKDSAVLFGATQIVAQQMSRKTPQNSQTIVPRRGAITPARFYVVQKGKHGICPKIVQS